MKESIVCIVLAAICFPVLSVHAGRPFLSVKVGVGMPIQTRPRPIMLNLSKVNLLFFNGEDADISRQKGATLLMEAAQKKAASNVEKIIAEKADVNAATETGITALMLAAKSGSLEIVKMLVSAGATIDGSSHVQDDVPLVKGFPRRFQEFGFSPFRPFQTDSRKYKDNKNGFTSLVLASSYGRTSVVEFLVSKGADVNRKGYGVSPLAAAISFDHPDVAMYLMTQNADIRSSEQILGRTMDLLYPLLDRGYMELAEHLVDLEHRDLNATANLQFHIPILHYYAQAGSVPAIKFLVRRGADINMVDHIGRTPIFHAVSFNRQEAVKTLLNLGADMNAVITPGKKVRYDTINIYPGATPVSLAIQLQYFNLAELLIQRGGNCDTPDTKGMTPLMHAVSGDSEDIVKLIINKGADVNAREIRGKRTALVLAIYAGKIDMAKLLLSKGADIHTKDKDGDGVILAALPVESKSIFFARPVAGKKRNETSGILDLLIAEGANINMVNNHGKTPLIVVIKNKEVKNVQLLLSRGADPSQSDKRGISPLQYALRTSCVECAGLLLDHGAKIGDGLIEASRRGKSKFAELFIQKGADVNVRDKKGRTALMMTAESDRLKIAQMLIENRANIDVKDNKGRTALIIAAGNGHLEMVKMLIENRANINARDKSGNNAFMIATLTGNKEVADYSKLKGADDSAWLKHAKKMKRKGFFPKNTPVEDMPPETLAFYKQQLLMMGIWNTDSWTTDSGL